MCRAWRFTGLAGGLHADVEVGDVVVASAAMQHDWTRVRFV